jgi:hypothetical protein
MSVTITLANGIAASKQQAQTPLPPVRRVVTGHHGDGSAHHLLDDAFQPMPVGSNGRACFKVLYTTDQAPACNNEPFVDPMSAATTSLANEAGTVFRVVDFAPHGQPVRARPIISDRH